MVAKEDLVLMNDFDDDAEEVPVKRASRVR